MTFVRHFLKNGYIAHYIKPNGQVWVSLSGQGQADIGARGGNCFSGYSSQTVKLFPYRSREH